MTKKQWHKWREESIRQALDRYEAAVMVQWAGYVTYVQN